MVLVNERMMKSHQKRKRNLLTHEGGNGYNDMFLLKGKTNVFKRSKSIEFR